RPHAVRHDLERAAAQGRQHPRRAGHAHRPPRAAGPGLAMRVLGISGSLRRDSHNARLLRAAAAELPPGWELELWEGLRDVPAYDEDLDVDPAPEAVRALREAIAGADALLIARSEEHTSELQSLAYLVCRLLLE